MPSRITWIGLQVKDCIITDLLAEGSFAWLYCADSITNQGGRIFKLAKFSDVLEEQQQPNADTNAIGFLDGATVSVRPDACMLVRNQYEKLRMVSDSCLPDVYDLFDENGVTYYDMELLHGKTLRQLANEGAIPLDTVIACAEALHRLQLNPDFKYHGDVRPENLFVTESGGIKLLDPGYFGPLQTAEGNFSNGAVTSILYYPSLTPNDLFAFGLMLWELATGEHPLAVAAGLNKAQSKEIPTGGFVQTTQLEKMVSRYNSVGNFNFDPLLERRSPCTIAPHLPEALESVILKAVGLKAQLMGKLTVQRPYQDFAELIDDLRKVRAQGVSEIPRTAKG